MMKISLPPDDPNEAGMTPKSRLYERFPETLPIVTYLTLMWCCVAHYLAYSASGGDSMLMIKEQMKLGALNIILPYGDPIWKLVTTAFIHSPSMLMHLVFNMMWLFQLGSLMERGIGSAKTAIFIIVCAFVCSSFSLSIEGPSIGFSGVVYAMAGFMWTAWPRWTGFLENFGGRTIRLMLGWQAICFVLSWLNYANIANTAHISGMLFGAIIGRWACRGNNKSGALWMASSIATAAIALLVWFWSPWQDQWRFQQDINNGFIDKNTLLDVIENL